MRSVAAAAFMVLFAVQGIGTVIYLFLIGRLMARLASHHAAVHMALGSPSLFANNTIRNGWLMMRWLLKRDYVAIPDPDTVRRANTTRLLFIALSVIFALLLALFFGLQVAYSS